MVASDIAWESYLSNKNGTKSSWNTLISWHLINGYLFSTPDIFIMGLPVDSSAPLSEIEDPTNSFLKKNIDAWYISVAALTPDTSLSRFFIFEPYYLPKIGFYRRNKFRWHNASFVKKARKHNHLPTTGDNNEPKITRPTTSSSPLS